MRMRDPVIVNLRVNIAQDLEYTATIQNVLNNDEKIYGTLYCATSMPIDNKKGYAVVFFRPLANQWRGIRFPAEVPVCQVAFSKRSSPAEEVIGCTPAIADAAKECARNLESAMSLLDDPDGTVAINRRLEYKINKYDLAHFVAHSIVYAYFGKGLINVPIRVTSGIAMHLSEQHPSDMIFPADKLAPKKKIRFATSARTEHKIGYLYTDAGDDRDIDVDDRFREERAIAINVSIKNEMLNGRRVFSSVIELERCSASGLMDRITTNTHELSQTTSFTRQINQQFLEFIVKLKVIRYILGDEEFDESLWVNFDNWLKEKSPLADTLAIAESIFAATAHQNPENDNRVWNLGV